LAEILDLDTEEFAAWLEAALAVHNEIAANTGAV
jgi:hypothetical protein